MAAKKNVKLKRGAPADQCFVLMPFGGWLDDYYETIYTPAINAAGLEPHRADDLFRPSTIVNDIWAYTKRAKLLLADLSGKNPNVFYELGLAHALAKPVILVAESMEEIPFDLRALRITLSMTRMCQIGGWFFARRSSLPLRKYWSRRLKQCCRRSWR